MSRIIPLDNIPGRMPRIGKISAGYMDAKTIQGRTASFPVKSRTLVFRCADPAVLHDAQKITSRTVSRSPNPRAEGVWRLISEARELQVVIATDDRRDAPARYEAWGASRQAARLRRPDLPVCHRTEERRVPGQRALLVRRPRPRRRRSRGVPHHDPPQPRDPVLCRDPGHRHLAAREPRPHHVCGPEGAPRIVPAPGSARDHGHA